MKCLPAALYKQQPFSNFPSIVNDNLSITVLGAALFKVQPLKNIYLYYYLVLLLRWDNKFKI